MPPNEKSGSSSDSNNTSSTTSCFALIKQQIAEREAAAVEVQNTFLTLSSGDAGTFVKSLSLPEDVLSGATAQQLIPPKELLLDSEGSFQPLSEIGVVTTAASGVTDPTGFLPNDVHAAIAALESLQQNSGIKPWPLSTRADLRQPSLSSTMTSTRRLSSDVFEDALRSYPSDPTTLQDLSTAAWLRSICFNSALESPDLPRLSTQDLFDFENSVTNNSNIWEAAVAAAGKTDKPTDSEIVRDDDQNNATNDEHTEHQKNALSEEELTEDVLKLIPKSAEGEMLSYGSIKHESGTCKPCVFFRHPRKGCHNGVRCLFCHFPHEPKKRVRVSRKRRAARQAAAAAASVGDSSPGFPAEEEEDDDNSSADPLLSQLVSMHQRQLLEKRLQALRPLFLPVSPTDAPTAAHQFQ